jgi:nitrate/TMAO reductase-like tetraheme cytochrome c subunit
MAERNTRRLLLVSVFVLAGLAGVVLVPVSMSRTSTTDYCISCHEMKGHRDELKKSSHAVDKDKKPIECAQCHVPNSAGFKYVTTKTVLGMKDLFVHYFGDPDRLNRRGMQNIARRFIPDENCLACHQDLNKTTKDQKISEIGKLCHDAYLGINGTTKRNCAGCHFNMAHLPEFDRRYFFNIEFAQRLPLEGTEEKL